MEKQEKTIKYLTNIKNRAERLSRKTNEKCDHGWQFGNDKKTTPNSAIQEGFCYRCGQDNLTPPNITS